MNSSIDTTAAAGAAREDNWFRMAARFEDALSVVRDLSQLGHTIAVANLDASDSSCREPIYRIGIQQGDEVAGLLHALTVIAERALAGEA